LLTQIFYFRTRTERLIFSYSETTRCVKILPYLCGIFATLGGSVVAVTGWIKALYEIRQFKIDAVKTRLEIQKLQAELASAGRQEQSYIHVPSETREIVHYSNSRLRGLVAVALVCGAVSVISAAIAIPAIINTLKENEDLQTKLRHTSIPEPAPPSVATSATPASSPTPESTATLSLGTVQTPFSEPKAVEPPFSVSPKHNEKFKACHLEGAARIGDRIYWIASHSRSKKEGKVEPTRQVLFATKVTGVDGETRLELVGKPFKGLQNALIYDGRLMSFELAEAAKKNPEELGGLNIESLCADGDALLIGFRNPVPGGKALLVPLKNPAAVIDSGASPMLGGPMLLDLNGLGIRDMARWGEEFIIVAGDFRDRKAEEAQPSRLFQWSGKSGDAPTSLDCDFGDLNPQGVVVYDDGAEPRLQLLSDDGGETFRSAWFVKARGHFQLSKPVKYPGAPSGSAGVASGTSHFIGACDEDNLLRLYPSDTDGEPKVLLDLNQVLDFPAP
jgi:hypothetical protein